MVTWVIRFSSKQVQNKFRVKYNEGDRLILHEVEFEIRG